ncbi:hypothetical protein K388_00792 [Streptomyces sp. KhCrAH-43]|uniref:hypothetical protein n=1 Tax=Streptomyces TaxID=1883 RepID=UPI000DC3F97A|nr:MULTISPECIES: hypothetical protein [unclassified Streptomyces]MYS38364.1 hypothetical protein [Streptomyces sp. SID4920]MYX66556.1 hypothetical protein [Streptomyces sp. SID8373]RAJ68049.1 hypothetical protein K388_00792 [Streptomyces sp. KhCrAH-43]
MNKTRTRAGVFASAIALTASGVTLGLAPAAEAAAPKPTGCSAYVSHEDIHDAVAWCSKGNGTWYVQADCTSAGRVNGPYRGSKGWRKGATEAASVLDCGTNAWPINLKVVNVSG